MKLPSCYGGERGVIATAAFGMIWLGTMTIAPASTQAADATVNVSAPIVEISGSNPGRLAEVVPGTLMNFTYTYPTDLSLTWHQENWRAYEAPIGATLSTLEAGTLYREFTKFSIQFFEGGAEQLQPSAANRRHGMAVRV